MKADKDDKAGSTPAAEAPTFQGFGQHQVRPMSASGLSPSDCPPGMPEILPHLHTTVRPCWAPCLYQDGAEASRLQLHGRLRCAAPNSVTPQSDTASWQEDWGEQYTGKRPPAVFVLSLRDWSVRGVQGFPKDSSMGQPAISPDGEAPCLPVSMGAQTGGSLSEAVLFVDNLASQPPAHFSGMPARPQSWGMGLPKSSCGRAEQAFTRSCVGSSDMLC